MEPRALVKQDLPSAAPEQINFITYNLADLPLICFRQYNTFLEPNMERAERFVEKILKRNDDIIALQEVWDIRVANYLVEKLSARYPHFIKGIGEYNGWLVQLLKSGLMIFSKYPIVASYVHIFGNHMIGEESVSFKGFMCALIPISTTEFITVYNTHLHAYGAIFNRASTWWGGSSHDRRDEQMRVIAEHMRTWATRPPEGTNLRHVQTIFMGDLNVPLNNEQSMLSISSGKSKLDFKNHQIKYLGQYHLLSLFNPALPRNFMDVRESTPAAKGLPKRVVPALKEQAAKEGKFTGTDNLRQTSPQAPLKLYDAMLASKQGQGNLVTNIVSLDDEKRRLSLSDHFGVEGRFFPRQKMEVAKSAYEGSEPVRALEPSNSKCCRRTRPRYFLYPTPGNVLHNDEVGSKFDQKRPR